MKRFLLSPEAADNIKEIWAFIAEDNGGGRASSARARGLAEMPDKGHKREDLTDKAGRFCRVRSYLIVYRPDTDPLEIVAVLHGACDIPQLL